MSTTTAPLENFIDGEFAPAADGATDAVLNPATGEEIAQVASSTRADVDRAVGAARAAFAAGWSTATPGARSLALLKIADAIEERTEEFVAREVANAGKPVSAFRDDEIPVAVDNLRFFAGAARNLEGKAAGDTIVLKPAPTTPLTTVKLAEVCAEFLPKGVLNVISGGNDAGAALVDHDDVNMVSLTGSVETGKWVAEHAARTLKKVHLELGGKAPVVVFDDVDMATALETIAATGYYNAGQDCTAATRVLAGAKVYDDVVAGLAGQARELVIGDTLASDTTLGPVNSERQRKRVEGFLERRPTHAEVVTGGGEPPREGF